VQKVPPIFDMNDLSEVEKHIMQLAGAKLTTAKQWFGTLYPWDVTIEGKTYRFYLSQAEVEDLWKYAKIRNMGGKGKSREEVPDDYLTIDDLVVEEGRLKIRGETGDIGFNVDPEDLAALSKMVLNLKARVEALEVNKGIE
jgi:hypothetical protein